MKQIKIIGLFLMIGVAPIFAGNFAVDCIGDFLDNMAYEAEIHYNNVVSIVNTSPVNGVLLAEELNRHNGAVVEIATDYNNCCCATVGICQCN